MTLERLNADQSTWCYPVGSLCRRLKRGMISTVSLATSRAISIVEPATRDSMSRLRKSIIADFQPINSRPTKWAMESGVREPVNTPRGRESQIMVHCILPEILAMSQFLHEYVISRVTYSLHVG